jgi:hypothetical protein
VQRAVTPVAVALQSRQVDLDIDGRDHAVGHRHGARHVGRAADRGGGADADQFLVEAMAGPGAGEIGERADAAVDRPRPVETRVRRDPSADACLVPGVAASSSVRPAASMSAAGGASSRSRNHQPANVAAPSNTRAPAATPSSGAIVPSGRRFRARN